MSANDPSNPLAKLQEQVAELILESKRTNLRMEHINDRLELFKEYVGVRLDTHAKFIDQL